MNVTRSTVRAGVMKAGDTIADNAPLADLLAPCAVAEADAALSLIESRRDAANAVAASHAARRDDALLAGAEGAHDAEAQRLADDARRLTVAAERITARRAELVIAESRAAGEQAAARAIKAAAALEQLVAEYTTVGQRVAELLAAIDTATEAVLRDRGAARAADVECAALLPHESRYRPELVEEREVIVEAPRVGVFDASGNRMGPAGRVNGLAWTSESSDRPTPIRRRERVVVQRAHIPASIVVARAVLPSVDGGTIIDRNRDEGRRPY